MRNTESFLGFLALLPAIIALVLTGCDIFGVGSDPAAYTGGASKAETYTRSGATWTQQ